MSLFPSAGQTDAARGLGAKINGGNSATGRQLHDFYPTPPDVTRAFMRAEGERLSQIAAPVWEPCARGGAMLSEIAAHGLFVIGTDIVPDPANHVAQLDVLKAPRALAPCVITNPPFDISAAIITHLIERLGVSYCALLLKASYWHAENRTQLFKSIRPARIYALNWRPDFLAKGAPVMECQWVVWDGQAEATTYDVLAREAEQERLL